MEKRNYHQMQMNNQNNANNINTLPPQPAQYEQQPLSDEEFLIRYQQKYPEEYEQMMKEAYLNYMNQNQQMHNENINIIRESPLEESNNNNINSNEDENNDIERILNNPNINISSPLELFLCNIKLHNDLFPFFKRQNVLTLEEVISFKNYQIKNKNLSSKVSLKNFEKEVEFLQHNIRTIRDELPKNDKYQQIVYLLQKNVSFHSEVTLDGEMILKSFINGTSTPNFCKMNKFQTQNLKPSSLYSANVQKFRITKITNNPPIEGFTSLKHLYLDSNNLQKIQGLKFPHLEELSLSDNYIRKIENLGGCPNLKKINLSFNMIHTLENIEYNQNLESIDVSNQYIPKFIVFYIKPNCTLPNNVVSSINIENSNLINPSAMVQFKYLQEVNLKSNSIDEMMDVLSIVKNCPYLRKINCLNNPFIAANKSTYRNFIVIAGKNLIEVDEKEVKDNEKVYVNQLYSRKFGKKRTKSREKIECDIGKQNLVVSKISRPNPKMPNPNNYYNYGH